jgi:hypothetical protein
MKKLRVKRVKDWDTYDVSGCVASRCMSGSTVILATKKVAPVDVGLCDYHLEMYYSNDE